MIDNLLGFAADNLLGAAAFYQAYNFHDKDKNLSYKLYADQVLKSTILSKQTHLAGTKNDLEMHFVQLEADIINATKESERDMFDQRNQRIQTVILSSTVMFAALITLIVEDLPDELLFNQDTSSEIIKVIFCFISGLSFTLLVTNIFFCLEILKRANSFMISRAEDNAKALKEGAELAERVFSDDKKQFFKLYKHFNDDAVKVTEFKENEFKENNKDLLEKEWEGIEEKTFENIQKRRKINTKFFNSNVISFEGFWNDNCKALQKKSDLYFYSGTMMMIISTLLWIYIHVFYEYDSVLSSIVGFFPFIFVIPEIIKQYICSNDIINQCFLKDCKKQRKAESHYCDAHHAQDLSQEVAPESA